MVLTVHSSFSSLRTNDEGWTPESIWRFFKTGRPPHDVKLREFIVHLEAVAWGFYLSPSLTLRQGSVPVVCLHTRFSAGTGLIFTERSVE